MFKLESYITPIILNHVAKYVKNIRPQDSQVSFWEGEVAFQNLDLRLDVLEEELQLPFEFLSGHIHELSIHVPWTKITSEPINITINTIEFVLKLKDQNSDSSQPKQERKKRISKVEESQQGYIPSLVNKIINNITINCHNIILKYVEDEIVVSMNIQLLSLSSADEKWQKAFADINPVKMVLRKLVQVSDLTICLDKRNEMGQIEVCLEPILYKCSLEIRLLRKYNVTTFATSSTTIVDLFSKALDINISSVQFPMAMRLMALVMALKSGELKSGHSTDVDAENSEDNDVLPGDGQSYLSWAWNLIPNILSTDDISEEAQSNEGHYMNIGFYIEELKLTLKLSEFISESIVQTTKRIRYSPILKATLKGIFSETLLSDQWFSTQAGVTSISIEPLGKYAVDSCSKFVFTETDWSEAYLNESLFDEVSEENSGITKSFITDYDLYIAKFDDSYLTYKGSALAFNMVHTTKYKPTLSTANSEVEDDLEKLLTRVLISSTNLVSNTTTFAILDVVNKLIAEYNYPPYIEMKNSEQVPSKLPPPSMDEYDALMKSQIPKREIQIVLTKIIFEFYPRTSPANFSGYTERSSSGIHKRNLPSLRLELEKVIGTWETPLNPNSLVITTCQLPEKPLELLNACYDNYAIKIKNVNLYLCDASRKERLLTIPYAVTNFGTLIQPDLWTMEDDVKYKFDARIDTIILSFTKPQLIVFSYLSQLLLDYNYDKLLELLGSSARSGTHKKPMASFEHTASIINITARKFLNVTCCSGSIKYFQSCLFVKRRASEQMKSFIFRAPIDVPLSVDDTMCNIYVQIPDNLKDEKLQPILAAKMSDFVIIADPALTEFLDFEEIILDFMYTQESSASVDIASQTDKSKIEKSSAGLADRPRKIVNPEETIHLSSEKEEKIVKARESTDRNIETRNSFELPSLKNVIVNVDIAQGSVYIPTETEFLTTISTLSTILAHNTIDYLNLTLPYIKLKSATSESFDNHLDITRYPKARRKSKLLDTFPWTCDLTNFDITTVINNKSTTLLSPAKTSITVALNNKKIIGKADQEILVVNIHIDTAPIHLELSKSQVEFFFEKINFMQDIVSMLKWRRESVVILSNDVRIVLNEEEDVGIKEFLALKTESESSVLSEKSKPKAEIQEITADEISCWLQWTVEKLTIDLISSLKPPTKLRFDFEDFITSIDKQSDYFKLKSKIGTMELRFFKMSESDWLPDDSIKLSAHTLTSKTNDSFFELTVTQAETISVFSKLGAEKKVQNLHKSLTEIVANIQAIECLLDLNNFADFVPILCTINSRNTVDKPSYVPLSVADLPLVYVQSNGITIYIPVVSESVFIFKVANITISPNVDNPLDRLNIRSDVYNKAAQMRILHTPGSKVEDRQYELIFQDISAATGNWAEILSFLKKDDTETFQNTNPAVEWNNKQGNTPSLDLKEIFSNFIISITYAPCIVYNNILISGQAIEFNCVTDLITTVTDEQLVIFANIFESMEYIQREKIPDEIKNNTKILDMEESSIVFVEKFDSEKNLKWKRKPSTTDNIEKLKAVKQSDIGMKYSEVIKKDKRKQNDKNSSKYNTSDYGYYTGFYPDSGIGCPIYEPSQTETIKERKVPSEISFVAGVFIFKFVLHRTRKKRRLSKETRRLSRLFTPTLVFTLNQPSMLISQKLFENFIQFSLFNIYVALNATEKRPSFVDDNYYLIETQSGPETLTGIEPPLLSAKVCKSAISNLQFDFSLLKPVVMNVSYIMLDKLLKSLQIVEDVFERIPRREIETRRPIVRGSTIERIRKMMCDASGINISIEKFILKTEEKNIYFITLSLINLRLQIQFFDRPEKMETRTSCETISIQLEDKTILHPVNFSGNFKMTQEAWYKDPITIGGIKFNVIHVDLGPDDINNFLQAAKDFKDVFDAYNDYRVSMSSCELDEPTKSIDRTKLDLIHVKKVVKENKNPREEFYQDDLRAGAFQFIIVEDDTELPMAYQIQIILKNNGIICWRYPQPRKVTRLQIYPIPMETTKPLKIRCRMEYFSYAHEQFLHFCDFHISETETNIVNIPQRKITSSIWRVVILQSFVIVDGQCFECACSSDEDDELKSVKIEDIFKPTKNESDFRLNPKALVACMRVDTIFYPTITPKIQAVIDCYLIQLNLQNQDKTAELNLPFPLQKYKLSNQFNRNHTFATLSLSNFRIHGAMLSVKEYLTDIDFRLSCKILDYSYLNMLCFLEEANIKSQIDLSTNVDINTTIDVIKLNVGPSILQTLMISQDHWQRFFDPTLRKYPIFTRYIVCNRTNLKLKFGQVDTKQRLTLKPRDAFMYHFLSDYHDQKLVFRLFVQEKVFIRSDPINVNEAGVQHVRIAEYVLILKIKKLSASQMCIIIRGQISILSMVSEELKIQLHHTEKNETISDTDTIVEYKSTTTFCAKVLDGTNLSMRLRFEESKGGSWSGEIPLRANKSLPWLVKVPQADTKTYISFWVRVIREDIPEVATNAFKPQRVLVIIWPMFMIRSMLPSPIQLQESTTKEILEVKGRGERIDLNLPGNHETEHKITFQNNFVSPHGEDKNVASLTFKTIDWNKFFWYDEKLWTVEYAINALINSSKINWPINSEKELQINRQTSENDCTTPTYRCLPSQDFSCSLLLDVSAWALFINSLSKTIEIRNYSNRNETLEINSNFISTLFVVQEAFIICVEDASNWACSDPIFMSKTKPSDEAISKSEGYYIEETGSVTIVVKNGNFISKFLLNSEVENGYRIFTLLPFYVIANFSKHSLQAFSFCIAESEHITRSALSNTYMEHCTTLPINTNKSQKGLALDTFYDWNASLRPRNLLPEFLFYVCLKLDEENYISIPIPVMKPLNRKCLSLIRGNETIPLAACIVEHKGQYYLNIYDDSCPAVKISNYTELSFFVAQAESLDASKETQVVSECDKNFSKWYQILKPSSQLLYTPPDMYATFPDIEPHFAKLALAIVNDTDDDASDNENNIQWSKPIRTDMSTEKYFNVPLHGDVTVLVCDKHKTVRICIFYATRATVFCVKDLRSRLNSTNDSSALLFHRDISENLEADINSGENNIHSNGSLEQTVSPSTEKILHSEFNETNTNGDKCIHKSEEKPEQIINANLFVKELSLNIFVDSKEKKCLKTEIFSTYIDDLALQFNGKTRKLCLIVSNLQLDNQLFSTGNYDFPVILCSEEIYKRIPFMPAIHNLQNEIEESYKQKPLIFVRVKFYDEELAVESVRFKLNPIRAYIEDTYLNDVFDYLVECNSESFIFTPKKDNIRQDLPAGEVLLPQDVINQVMYLSEPVRLKSIRIDPMSILISVHTCVRLYVALDHSPLEFTAYEKKNIITLPIKFGHALGMHYLSGALFGAGWVVGSLEILGSPSGLARSFSIGLRDFVSMPVQGLLRGPWGFIVGVTHGSASLLRNVTAGTVNSVTKLAASVARNLDRLTLDDEHFQRTEALRRSRPQGFAEGLSQGLTGFGISLLGAVGGLARHTLEAKSPVQVVTGVGKGIVGAFAKPISGAAELLALTGQGMLHTVGFNTMPQQRFLITTRNLTVHLAEYKIAKLLPAPIRDDQILLFHEATVVLDDTLKRAIIFITNTVLAVLDIEKSELAEILPLEKIEASFDENDRTLINLHFHEDPSEGAEEVSFTNQRIINYLKLSDRQSMASRRSLDNTGEFVKREKLKWSFYINEQLGQHLLNYLKIISKSVKTTTEKPKF